ncbi:SagB-type dehydrogenase domain [Ignisphaera aggregans DSM 17230]|uniref:SagB-type dehydrogenase domain n=1 Tax=Ignisphaera aggregans (strain DSM 17230 / JCM 13409 / AQ1.S1) TaxID=583356 RepID=E0SQU2_IGNAA|nr:SagB-type dehydrogenase domain [Ignisphaera aggregans DSM 17230]
MRVERIAYLISFLLTFFIIVYVIITVIGIPRPLEYIQPTPPIPSKNLTIVIGNTVLLPPPRKMTNISVEEAILLRRSIREYTEDPIPIDHLSMILWAAYGITETRWGLRAAPSAGATYPLEIYVVIGRNGVSIGSEFLDAGVYKYDPHRHILTLVKSGDVREELYVAALRQEWVRNAPVNIVIFAVFERTTRVYGYRGEVRYVPMEVGHVGQNIYLIATALGYGCVVIGAFYDDEVSRVIGAQRDEVPMYIVPIGVPKHPYRVSFEDIERYIESMRG